MGCKVQESWWKKQAKGVQKTGNGVQKRQGWVQANKTGKWVQEVQTRGSKKTERVIKKDRQGEVKRQARVEEGMKKGGE
jgi:hypothetical protein